MCYGVFLTYLSSTKRHKSYDPWGAYLRTDGAHVDQGGTKVLCFLAEILSLDSCSLILLTPCQWVDTSAGNWQDYNAHGVADSSRNGKFVML